MDTPQHDTSQMQAQARDGIPEAQHQMGEACAKGVGVPKDARESARWHRRAAEQGHHWSMYKLGKLYEKGAGVLRSAAKAREWYTRAAGSGNPKTAQALQASAGEYGDVLGL